MTSTLIILSVLGFLASMYALHVEKRKEESTSYNPACDINNSVSCSKAFKSKYGHMLGLSNSVYGILFYLGLIVLDILKLQGIIYLAAISAVVGSVALAYISYVKQRNFCVICTSIYVINILILANSLNLFG